MELYQKFNKFLDKHPVAKELTLNKEEAFAAHTLVRGEKDPYYFLHTDYVQAIRNPSRRQARFPATSMSAKRKLDFGSRSPLAKKIKSLEKRVQQNKNVLRYKDFTVNNAQLDTDFNFDVLKVVQRGDTQADRTGNTILIKKIEVFTNAVAEDDRIRLVLYSPYDVGSVVPSAPTLPFNFHIDRDKFRIWDDARYSGVLTNVGPTAQSFGGRQMNTSKTFGYPMKTVFKEDGNVSHNDIYICAFKERPEGIRTLGDSNTNISINGRVWFYDA